MDYGYFLSLQIYQRDHDLNYVVPVAPLSKQLQRYALHVASMAGEMMVLGDVFPARPLISVFSIALSAANEMHLNLSHEIPAMLKAGVSSPTPDFWHSWGALQHGLAKAGEEFDHASRYPSRAKFEEHTTALTHFIDAQFEAQGRCIYSALVGHLREIEDEVCPLPKKIPAFLGEAGIDFKL